MATNGKIVKTKSLAQRINHRRFKANGAAGFALGSANSCRHNLERLAEQGRGLPDGEFWATYRTALSHLRAVEMYIADMRMTVLGNLEAIELAQEKYNATHNRDRP